MFLFRIRWLFLCAVHFVFLCVFFPTFAHAFVVTPSVVDVPYAVTGGAVTQTITIKNTHSLTQEYALTLKKVSFTPQGDIDAFSSFSGSLHAGIDVSTMTLAPGEEGACIFTLEHPEYLHSDDIFSLVIRENNTQNDITGGFAVLLFPRPDISQGEVRFRIDAFSLAHEEDRLRATVQYTNIGEILVQPAGILFARDMFGRTIFKKTFAPYEGRLPVGVTRTVDDVFPESLFGAWHVGGRVTVTLVAFADVSLGISQQASFSFMTFPGRGILGLGSALILLGGFGVFFIKKRGILKR